MDTTLDDLIAHLQILRDASPAKGATLVRLTGDYPAVRACPLENVGLTQVGKANTYRLVSRGGVPCVVL